MLPVIKAEPDKNYLARFFSFISMFYEEFVPVFELGLFLYYIIILLVFILSQC